MASPPKAVPTSYPTYYQAKDKNKKSVIYLEDEEEENRKNDYQEMLGMKEHHRDQHDNWNKAGNFYNIVQGGEGNDNLSRYAIGLSRTIIDTGIAMVNEGEPEGEFEPLTPSDKKINILWNSLMKHVLDKSNWKAHQKLFTTDLHIFGASTLESFINPVFRRQGEEPGLFLIRLAKTARTGLRHRSIWHTFRNANVCDPDDVPSGSYEEIITYSYWNSNYAGRKDLLPCAKQMPVASKYKLTHIFNELDNTQRTYCLPFGVMAEAQYEQQPDGDELGFPILSKKLTDMNPLGMVPLAFGTFNDQLTADYKQHSLYGMGIPQMIEGMEMIMEGLFNMTVDNMRLKNTVPVGYQPYSGQTDFPDLTSIGYMDSGRVYPGTFSPTSLGIADLQSNTVLWEWINNICIWLTGYNFQQLGGDTSKTAYEFAQRLKANSNRALARLKGLENGPLKRAWTLTLANTLSQIRKDEWEQMTDLEAKEIKSLLDSGDASLDDYKLENGQVKSKRFVEYFNVKDYDVRESFSKSKKRVFGKGVDDTLTIKEKKGANSKVAAVPEHLFPRGDIAQMLNFSTKVKSKTMLGDLRTKDAQAIQGALTSGMSLMPVTPQITPDLMFKLWKQQSEDAGLDIDGVIENREESDVVTKVKELLSKLQDLRSTPSPSPDVLAQQDQGMAVPSAPQSGAGVTTAPQGSPTLKRLGR